MATVSGLDEFTRRQSNTAHVLKLLESRPSEWIDASEFMSIAGAMAWRTRISNAREIIEARGGVIENRTRRNYRQEPSTKILKSGKVKHYLKQVLTGPIISEYRYLPYQPLARDAGVEISGQRTLHLDGAA